MTVYDFLKSFPSYRSLLVFDAFDNEILYNGTVGGLMGDDGEVFMLKSKRWEVDTHRFSSGIIVIHANT